MDLTVVIVITQIIIKKNICGAKKAPLGGFLNVEVPREKLSLAAYAKAAYEVSFIKCMLKISVI